jgi:hypothetical protein
MERHPLNNAFESRERRLIIVLQGIRHSVCGHHYYNLRGRRCPGTRLNG